MIIIVGAISIRQLRGLWLSMESVFRFESWGGVIVIQTVDWPGFLLLCGVDIVSDLFATDVEGNVDVDRFAVGRVGQGEGGIGKAHCYYLYRGGI